MSKKSQKTKRATPKAEVAAVLKGKSVISHATKQAWAKKPDDALDAALAFALDGSENALLTVAHENTVEFRWTHLNRGMQRMALGNVLRGKMRRGEKVSVDGTRITA